MPTENKYEVNETIIRFYIVRAWSFWPRPVRQSCFTLDPPLGFMPGNHDTCCISPQEKKSSAVGEGASMTGPQLQHYLTKVHTAKEIAQHSHHL